MVERLHRGHDATGLISHSVMPQHMVKVVPVASLYKSVISKEHPVSGGGGVSGSRFNVRYG